MERKPRIDTLGALVLIAFMFSLGLNQALVKIMNTAMTPLFQAGLRSLCAAPLMLAWCLWRSTPIDLSKKVFIPGLITGICFATEFGLLFEAVQHTTVARASVFFYTMPFWVAIAAHFLIPNERLTPIRIVGLVLAGIGVAVALLSRNEINAEFSLWGDMLALIAAVFWAVIAIVARTTALSTAKPELQLLYQLAVSAIILLPVCYMTDNGFSNPEPWHFAVFAIQVLLIVCVGFLTWFWVLSIYPASDMASFSFLAPLFGVFFGWLLLNEPITWTIVIAVMLVGMGIVLVNRR